MLFHPLLALLAIFCSLFTAVASLPTIRRPFSTKVVAKRLLVGPKSLLGRTYLRPDIQRHETDDILEKSVLPRARGNTPEKSPTLRRTDRFQAVQKRKAQGIYDQKPAVRPQANSPFSLFNQTEAASVRDGFAMADSYLSGASASRIIWHRRPGKALFKKAFA